MSIRERTRATRICLLALVATIVVLQYASAMSIETSDPQNKPVKVTHKDPGPSYDIDISDNETGGSPNDSVEKKKVVVASHGIDSSEQPISLAKGEPESESGVNSDSAERPMIGHFQLRRILLVPLASRPRDSDGDGAQDERTESSDWQPSSPFAMNPLWHFLIPSSNPQPSDKGQFESPRWPIYHRRIFGEDQASRSPTAVNGNGERESGNESMFDPMRMILELMHQAINEHAPKAEPGDLNKEATTSRDGNKDTQESDNNNNDNNNSSKESTSSLSTLGKSPQSKNETKEEIVEIEGKKYLKKSIINRHVGENIIFMTKRLIFVPLNETDSETSSTMANTSSESTTKPTEDAATSGAPVTTSPTDELKISAEPISTRTTSTSTTAAATTPTTTAVPQNQDATTAAESIRSVVEESTTKVSLLDRVSEAIDNAAERLVEKAMEELSSATSTAAPQPSTTTTAATTAATTTTSSSQQ